MMRWLLATLIASSFLGTHLIGSQSAAADRDDLREAPARRASLLLEAKQYGAAREIYQNLLNGSSKDWERSILHYNIGTIDLVEGRWREALAQFHEIDLAHNLSPRLIRRIQINAALALLGRSRTIRELELPSAEYPEYSLEEISSLLKEALVALEAGEAADCRLVEREGHRSCETAADITETRRLVKRQLMSAQEQIDALRIATLSRIDIIGLLMAQLRADKKAISSMPPAEALRYLHTREADRQRYWQTLRLQSTLTHTVDKILADHPPVQSAEDGTQQWEEAYSRLLQELTQLALMDDSNDSLQTRELVHLRLGYAEAIGGPLGSDRLQDLQKRLLNMSADLSDVNFQAVQQSTQYGVEALTKGRPATARIYLTLAAHWLDHTIAEKRQPLTGRNSEALLDAAIDEEEFSRRMVQAVLDLPIDEYPPEPALLSAVAKKQDRSLTLASSFLEAALVSQQQEYREGQCQRHPWQGALPAFFEGKVSARNALLGLQQMAPSLPVVLESQRDAYQAWMETRRRLRSAPHREALMSQSPLEQGQKIPLEETIRLLQQMDSEDRNAPQPGTMPSGVQRPW